MRSGNLAFGLLVWALPACTSPQPFDAGRPVPPDPFLAAAPPTEPAPAVIHVPAPERHEPATATLSALPGEVIPPGGVDSKWRYIIIHHSATDTGTAHSFHRYHLSRGWEHGLGYHFVIGNASGAEDGRIEVGHRWRGQMTGAHCKSTDNRYNRFGIGICLVGNFENREPSAAQTANLEALVRFLASECHIAPQHIYGHGDLADTRCPGEHFSLSGLKNRLQDARHGGLGSRHSNP